MSKATAKKLIRKIRSLTRGRSRSTLEKGGHTNSSYYRATQARAIKHSRQYHGSLFLHSKKS